jgi:hypothetical protein
MRALLVRVVIVRFKSVAPALGKPTNGNTPPKVENGQKKRPSLDLYLACEAWRQAILQAGADPTEVWIGRSTHLLAFFTNAMPEDLGSDNADAYVALDKAGVPEEFRIPLLRHIRVELQKGKFEIVDPGDERQSWETFLQQARIGKAAERPELASKLLGALSGTPEVHRDAEADWLLDNVATAGVSQAMAKRIVKAIQRNKPGRRP